MCGRYHFSVDGSDELLQILQEIRNAGGDFTPGELTPASTAPVLIARKQAVVPTLMRWGFQTQESLVINARAETARDKPLFRGGIAAQRCLIPASGFYEWDAARRKFLFTVPGEQAFYMAGIYRVREDQSHYCILTTAANDSMRPTHPRMPLILRRDQLEPWLRDLDAALKLLHSQPPSLERTSAEPQLSLW